jgi:hypothetical protein
MKSRSFIHVKILCVKREKRVAEDVFTCTNSFSVEKK